MYLLYSLLFTFGLLLLAPRFLLDALRHGKYVQGLGQRLGRLPLIDTKGRPVIWLHCVSVGETQAARPVAEAVLRKLPDYSLIISTITLTGQGVAREVFRREAEAVIYFPFDWAWTVRRTLKRVNPEIVLIMETELWPRFLLECRKRGVPVALVNGRLSEKSFRRYKLIGGFMRRVVDCLELGIMQSERDAERMRGLGLDDERTLVSGNVKFDLPVGSEDVALTERLRQRFGLTGAEPLIIAASTHEGEERICLEALKRLRETRAGSSARLLFAPRHPERFDEAAALLTDSGMRWARRSEAARDEDKLCDLILLDSIGELRAVYPLATLVFVGGSLVPKGGHNILEPVAAGACVVTGAHTNNFAAIIEAFLERDAIYQLPPLTEEEAAAELAGVLEKLLSDDAMRRKMTERASLVMRENQGATSYSAERIAELLVKRR